MKRTGQVLLSALLVLTAAAWLTADDKQASQDRKKKATKSGEHPVVAKAFAVPNGIELSAEQKEKWAGVKKELGAKLEDAAKKRDEILTDDQRKARRQASKAARDAGKKGKALKAAIDEAMKLTEEQKKKMADADKAVQELQRTVQEKLTALLTDEQRAKLPKKAAPKKKKNSKL